ncbi:MAG: T9SS type A sorting domain-containing protein [Bacteroidota bacterium]
MKKGFIILLILLRINCIGQDTIKVLFVGNSFMSFNDLPTLFSQLAEGAGEHVIVASRIPGGASVGDTIQGTFAHMYSPEVYALIKSNDWDYLFLQDRQSRFCMPYGIFPGDSKVIEGHTKIRDSLLFYHPCAHMIWFAGFGTKNGYFPYSTTGVGLIDSIYQNYQFLEDSIGQVIAPIGPAYLRIIADHPSIDLWGPDEEHPSLKGSLLIASVVYTTIFKSSPMVSNFNPGIPVAEDSILKSTGYQTTMDSLGFSGLASITPTIVQSGNSLMVNGYPTCGWFFNRQPSPANNCVAEISQSGNYYAVVTNGAGCKFRTLENYYSINTGTGERNRTDLIAVYPLPASSTISINANVSISHLKVIDSTMKIMKEISHPSKKTELDISAWPEGLYLILVTNEKGVSQTIKFLKQ